MTTETVLLVGRDAGNAAALFETHAARLRSRGVADSVEVATFETEPVEELREQCRQVTADQMYAVPMSVAHTHETLTEIPQAFSRLSETVNYCEPIGRTRAVTEVIERNATAEIEGDENTSLILVSFGSSSKPYHRKMAEYHSSRLREQTEYGEVVNCYLLQNPAVECVRYNITNDAAVAVPLFLSRTEATTEQIPAKLELDRGGIEYAPELGMDPRITDALAAEIEKQRTLGTGGHSSLGQDAMQSQQPVATDGDGGSRR